jgi:gluconate 5-dehydrogenase
MRLFDLNGRYAVVTGAASGLGKAIALGLAEAGATVMAVDIDADGAAQTAAEIRAAVGAATSHQADVTREDSVEQMVSATCAEFPRLDISFNIPGINIRKPALELSLAEFRRVIEVDLVGVFIAARAVGRVMVAQRSGRMVNMSSIMGHIAVPKQSGYSSAKGGVSQLTKVLALEWAPYNVTVNALCPGYMKTPLVKQIMQDDAWREDIEHRTPMGRLGEPEEVVGPAIFLVSDAASYVTGSTLFVDGGWLAW